MLGNQTSQYGEESCDPRVKTIFSSPKEQAVCVLGDNHLNSYLSGGGAGTGFAVLSDRRIYFRGCYFEMVGKKFRRTSRERALDLKDVTGTGIRKIGHGAIKVFGLIFITIALFCLSIGMSLGDNTEGVEGNVTGMILTGAAVCGIIGAWFLILFFTSNINALLISYSGGCIALPIKFYGYLDCQRFQQAIGRAKDELAEASENAAASAVQNAIQSMTVPVQQPVSSADELTKYADLFEKGVISKEDFEKVKANILRNT